MELPTFDSRCLEKHYGTRGGRIQLDCSITIPEGFMEQRRRVQDIVGLFHNDPGGDENHKNKHVCSRGSYGARGEGLKHVIMECPDGVPA